MGAFLVLLTSYLFHGIVPCACPSVALAKAGHSLHRSVIMASMVHNTITLPSHIHHQYLHVAGVYATDA